MIPPPIGVEEVFDPGGRGERLGEAVVHDTDGGKGQKNVPEAGISTGHTSAHGAPSRDGPPPLDSPLIHVWWEQRLCRVSGGPCSVKVTDVWWRSQLPVLALLADIEAAGMRSSWWPYPK